MKISAILILFCLFLLNCSFTQEYKLELKSDRGWKLQKNEISAFSVKLLGRKNPEGIFSEVKGKKIRVIQSVDGIRKPAKILISGTKKNVVTCSLAHPGWINLKFTLLDDSGNDFVYQDKNGRKQKVTAGIGALVEPEKFQPGFQKPADFDAFWDKQRKISDDIPFQAKLTEVEPAAQQKGMFRCYDLQLDCAGGMPVSGYLCIPINAKEKSLPAIVSFHGAGFYSANKSANPFPAIYLDINSHGIPNGKSRKFYSEHSKKLPRYWHLGAENRETFYFRGMYFRAMRALDYVKSRPEWNRRILVVTGKSMGGAQALAAAGLDPDVTLCQVSVSAMCDHGGSLAVPKRAPGWPMLFDVRHNRPIPGRVKTAPYYDNLFFADRMKCEVLLTAGLDDFTCCPTSIYTLYNRLKSLGRTCEIEIFPAGGHISSYAKKGPVRVLEHLKE